MLDPKNFFTNTSTKDILKKEYNLTTANDLAEERFRRDISVLNFFFDTPIITKICLEMRVSMFDKLSAIGGTLGLYTGISIITMIEIVWWLIQFGVHAFRSTALRDNHTKVDVLPAKY